MSVSAASSAVPSASSVGWATASALRAGGLRFGFSAPSDSAVIGPSAFRAGGLRVGFSASDSAVIGPSALAAPPTRVA